MRSLQKEDVSVPELGWEFFDPSYFHNNFDNCKTRCENILLRIYNKKYIFDIFSDNRPCVFPFNYWGVDHDQCTSYRADDINNEKVVKLTIYNLCHPCMFIV